jgi:hypothetical protein
MFCENYAAATADSDCTLYQAVLIIPREPTSLDAANLSIVECFLFQ